MKKLLLLLVTVAMPCSGMFITLSNQQGGDFVADLVFVANSGTWTDRVVLAPKSTVQIQAPTASVRFVGVTKTGVSWNAGPFGSPTGEAGQYVFFNLYGGTVTGGAGAGGVEQTQQTTVTLDWQGNLPQEAQVFLYGFFFGVTLELFGLLLRVVRGIRGGTGLE